MTSSSINTHTMSIVKHITDARYWIVINYSVFPRNTHHMIWQWKNLRYTWYILSNTAEELRLLHCMYPGRVSHCLRLIWIDKHREDNFAQPWRVLDKGERGIGRRRRILDGMKNTSKLTSSYYRPYFAKLHPYIYIYINIYISLYIYIHIYDQNASEEICNAMTNVDKHIKCFVVMEY